MNQYEIYHSCLRKNAYVTRESAQKAAAKRKRIELSIYRCNICLGFHLTRKKYGISKKKYAQFVRAYEGIDIIQEDETYFYIELLEENIRKLAGRGWELVNDYETFLRKKRAAVMQELRLQELKKMGEMNDEKNGDKTTNHPPKLENLLSPSFALKLITLRQLFACDTSQLAEGLGVSEETVCRWEKEKHRFEPTTDEHQQFIDALQTIAEALTELFEPNMIEVWVERPNPALQGQTPKDFVKQTGGVVLMAKLLYGLGD